MNNNAMNPSPNYKSAAGEQAVMALYDKLLTGWPVPYTTMMLPTRHGDIHVIASGPTGAPPVLLLHGAASNALAWMGEIEAISRTLRVYAIDLPGEAGRSDPKRPAWDGPSYVELMEDVLRGLGVKQVALVGLSQGGWTALKFAAAQPERVSRLVLLAPGGVVSVRASFLLRALPLSLLGRRGGEAISRIVRGNQPIDPAAVEYMNVIMTHFKSRVGALPNFSDAELARLTMPVLLILGEQDALFESAKIAARLQKLLPHLTVRLLPDVGHVLHSVSNEIAPFLAEEQVGAPVLAISA
jgi:pimeloyl-ACP methyl ester carboxylesterase